jgi:hypothetical protein
MYRLLGRFLVLTFCEGSQIYDPRPEYKRFHSSRISLIYCRTQDVLISEAEMRILE